MIDNVSLTTIAAKHAAGIPNRLIAEELGVSEATISRRTRTEEIKPYIEAAKKKLLTEYLPKSVDNIGHAIDKFKQLKAGEDNQLRYFGYRASEKMLENIGILGTPSVQFNTMINAQSTHIHPIIKEILAGQDVDVIDIDIENDNDIK